MTENEPTGLDDFTETNSTELVWDAELTQALKQVASGSCALFARSFAGCELVEQIAARGEPHWLLDLLKLWRPAGQPSGADGLRLAVRDGYLNFYRRGQSIAKVSTVRGELRGEVHSKYFSEAARKRGGQVYGRFGGSRLESSHGDDERYEGLGTLRRWIGLIDRDYAGTEKTLVDRLVCENDDVIDLEMGLPAWGSKRSAMRMDLVTIEGRQIVFWEVKCAGNPEIRCRSAENMPKVVGQLSHYREFLTQDTHRRRIVEAYGAAAVVMVRLRSVADRIGPAIPLSPAIVSAQTDELTVAREAALVVIDENALSENGLPGARWLGWHENKHAEKLRGKCKVLALARPGRLRLANAV